MILSPLRALGLLLLLLGSVPAAAGSAAKLNVIFILAGDLDGISVLPGSLGQRADSGEKSNVAARHPDVVRKFEAYLKTARVDSELWPINENPAKGRGAAKEAVEP